MCCSRFPKKLLFRLSMASHSAIHNPLAINLRGQTRALLESLPLDSPHVNALRTASESSTQLVAVLSSLLSSPDLTLLIATIYRPILLDLCARWLDDPKNTEDQLVALCYLLEVHEEIYPSVPASVLALLMPHSIIASFIVCCCDQNLPTAPLLV